MKDYLMLTKLLLHMQFKKDTKSKVKRSNTVAYIILGAFVFVAVAMMMIFLGSYIKDYGFVAETAAVIMFMGFFVVLIFGTMHLLSYMYFSPDNEFLMSLPFKSGTVYAAKLTIVYAMNAVLAAIFIVPGLLFLGISAGQGVLFFLMAVLAMFLVPVLPLLLASLLAIPLMYITSLFKHKGAITTVLLILVFSGIMIAYMVFIYNFNMSGEDMTDIEIAQMIQSVKNVITIMAMIIYPLYSLGRFMTLTPGLSDNLGASMAIDAGIFFGTLIVLAVVVLAFSSVFYRKSALRQMENPIKSNVGKRDYVGSSSYKALLKKEWRELIRNTSFAFQCLTGVILVPIMSVVVTLLMGQAFTGAGTTAEDLAMGMFMIWIMPQFIVQMMGVGMNFFSMTAITREGKSYEISKVIPVDYTVQLKAKKTIGLAISMVPIALSLIFMQVMQFVYGNYNPVLFFFAAAALLVINYGFTCYFINRDLKSPRLDWSTPAEAVKNNKATLLPFFVNFGVTIVCIIIMVVFGAVGMAIDMYIVMMIVGYLIMIAGGIGFAIPMHRALKNNTEKCYNKLGDN